jgi:hypothetical protein
MQFFKSLPPPRPPRPDKTKLRSLTEQKLTETIDSIFSPDAQGSMSAVLPTVGYLLGKRLDAMFYCDLISGTNVDEVYSKGLNHRVQEREREITDRDPTKNRRNFELMCEHGLLGSLNEVSADTTEVRAVSDGGGPPFLGLEVLAEDLGLSLGSRADAERGHTDRLKVLLGSMIPKYRRAEVVYRGGAPLWWQGTTGSTGGGLLDVVAPKYEEVGSGALQPLVSVGVIAPCAVKLPQDPRSLEELWIADKLLNPKDRDYVLPQQQVPLDKDRCDVY